MKVPVQIPKVSMAIDEATPLEWYVPDGQQVTEGQPLFLLATDKTETDVTAPTSGVVHWDAELDQTYPVGTRLGWIESPD